MNKTILIAVTLCDLLLSMAPASEAVGTAFTYQGLLTLTANGSPVTGLYDFNFNLFSADSGGSPVTTAWTRTAVGVTNGLFTTSIDFGGVFTGTRYWLEIGSRPNGSGADFDIAPSRQELTPVPYAMYAASAGTATGVAPSSVSAPQLNTVGGPSPGQVLSYNGTNLVWLTAGPGGSGSSNAWLLGGNVGTTSANFVGTTDNHPLELRVNNARALRLELNLTGPPNVIGGAAVNYVAFPGVGATIAGGGAVNYGADPQTGDPGLAYTNSVTGDFGTVSGGSKNVSFYYGTVGGGEGNTASQSHATVGGGAANHSTGSSATVGGGAGNTSSGVTATVSGGSGNVASADYAAVGGGLGNRATLTHTVIAGGRLNTNSAGASAIGGGQQNQIDGGAVNAVIGGGYNNHIYPSAISAIIPGGTDNTAAGFGSFAAGRNAHANHDGSFVWGDGTGGAYSGGPNRFDVLATGGFGFHVGTGNVTIDAAGNLNVSREASVCTLTIRGGCDLAEPFQMSGAENPEGAVVVIDEEQAGQLKLSQRAYDTRVAGIVSGANGIKSGIALHQDGVFEGGQNVALSGRVYVLADASSGPIRPGDLLTTSDTPGHAMKVTDPGKAQGAVLGKAMSSLIEGKGMVLVLVTLQ